MRAFELAEWIDGHRPVRHDLAQSGMAGEIPVVRPSRRELASADPDELTRLIASRLRVDRRRVFLTHGATEATSWVAVYLAGRYRRRQGRTPTAWNPIPDYPPLRSIVEYAGFRRARAGSSVDVAIRSHPSNPLGTVTADVLSGTDGVQARSIVIDETFREFTSLRSVAEPDDDRVWATGTLTKAYGADELRVGWAVAPSSEAERFRRCHAILGDDLPRYSVAAGSATLRRAPELLRTSRAIFERNRRTLERSFGRSIPLAAPVWFDRVGDGNRLARAALRASVLVCPGALFFDPTGVRLCLTRRTFPTDLTAYRRVRAHVVAA